MAGPDGELTVAQRPGRALDRGLLPAGGPAEAAERLIERLERPARIALLGLPGAGKSSILNLLVGAVVVPETLRLPTIIVQHGDVSRMVCTLTDGTTKILPGGDLAEVLPLAPALVTLELDLPALRVISLLEVSAGPMEAEQKRAATWASKRADIVIWCTTSYLPKEQAVWESLPDSVKDNSFMFLTKVDLLGSRDSAQAMHDRVELRAGEEFRQILSVSAKQARAAMPAGGQVNRELFRDSGAAAVISATGSSVWAAGCGSGCGSGASAASGSGSGSSTASGTGTGGTGVTSTSGGGSGAAKGGDWGADSASGSGGGVQVCGAGRSSSAKRFATSSLASTCRASSSSAVSMSARRPD